MSIWDDAGMVWGEQGPPGAATVEQVGDLEARVAAREAITIPTVITDMTDVSDTPATEGQVYQMVGGVLTPVTLDLTKTITVGLSYIIDGAGSPVSPGLKYGFYVPHDCTITGWVLGADVSTTAFIGVWIDTYANFPPTIADEKFAVYVNTGTKNSDFGYNVAVAAGSFVYFNVAENNNATVLLPNLLATRDI